MFFLKSTLIAFIENEFNKKVPPSSHAKETLTKESIYCITRK